VVWCGVGVCVCDIYICVCARVHVCKFECVCAKRFTHSHVKVHSQVHVLGRQVGVCHMNAHNALRELVVLIRIHRCHIVTDDHMISLAEEVAEWVCHNVCLPSTGENNVL